MKTNLRILYEAVSFLKYGSYFINKDSNLSRLLQVRPAAGNTKLADPNVGLKTPLIMVNGDVEGPACDEKDGS